MPEKNFENKVYVFWHTIKMNFLSKIWYFSAAAGAGHAAEDGDGYAAAAGDGHAAKDGDGHAAKDGDGESRMNRNGETIKL